MQPLRRLALIGGVLARQAIDLGDAERFELGKMIAKPARLRRAAARAGNVVPAGRRVDTGNAGARVDVKDGDALQLGQGHSRTGGRWQFDVRQAGAGEMPCAAIVDRYRQIRRQPSRIVRSGSFSHRRLQYVSRRPWHRQAYAYDMNSISKPSGSRK